MAKKYLDYEGAQHLVDKVKEHVAHEITMLDVDDVRDQINYLNKERHPTPGGKSLADQVEDNRTDIETMTGDVDKMKITLQNVDNLSDNNMERLNELEPRVQSLESSAPTAITNAEIDAMFA